MDVIQTSSAHSNDGASYNGVAWIYDLLGTIYSGGQIHAAKASQIEEMRPLDKVLYAGVGPGDDALLAARHGAAVTCLDIAPQMLKQASARLARENLSAEMICGNILAHDRRGHYDVVVVNFFLNVFDEQAMRRMLVQLVSLVRPGGKLLISDFALPRGGLPARALQAMYWGVTDLFYYLLGLCAWHPIYDYASYFPEAGVELHSVKHFRPYRIGPGGFYAITAQRPPAIAGPVRQESGRSGVARPAGCVR